MDDATLETLMLYADLNNDMAAEEAYASACARAKETGFSGEIQGPTFWSGSEKAAPVNVYTDGVLSDAFIRWLDD